VTDVTIDDVLAAAGVYTLGAEPSARAVDAVLERLADRTNGASSARRRMIARRVAWYLRHQPGAELLVADALDAAGPLEGWPEAPEEPGPPEPEAFPVDALPSALGAYVTSVAGHLQVPPDLPATLALGVLAASVAGRVEARVGDTWREPANLYTAVIMPPGSRKSPTYRLMTAFLRRLEREAVAEAAPRVLAAQDRVEVHDKRLDSLKRDAGKGKATADEVEAARIELEEARAKVPPSGRILAGDVTPEAMVQRMAAQGGRLALLEPEPGPLQLLAGRYSDAARLDELKKAWSGEAILVDRVGRPPLRVARPVLTLSLCMQPGVLDELQNRRAFRTEGVLARFLWSEPPHGLGHRRTGADVPALDAEAERAFSRILRILFGLQPLEVEPDGIPVPHLLRLGNDALDVLHAFQAEIEPQLADGARLEGIRDWASKAEGHAVRIAALLELAARASDGGPLVGDPVGARAMESAVRIMRAYTTHALAVFGQLGMDERTELLRYVLARVESLPDGCKERDVFEACKGRAAIERMDDLRPLLDDLEERGCLRVSLVPARGGGAGRPSTCVELHPSLSRATPEKHSQNSQNSPPEADPEGIADSANGNGGLEDDLAVLDGTTRSDR